MKYRHSYHAGNFADVHKHVTLLALIGALQRKDKGFLYLETHAGRGHYDLAQASGESRREAHGGIERLSNAELRAAELRAYVESVAAFRAAHQLPGAYPGSPLLVARRLRSQDRAVLIELEPSEARALQQALRTYGIVVVECDDGFARLRAHLPPRERRGLTFIDPPYEETRQDFDRILTALAEAQRRFPTGVIAAWYPIKAQQDVSGWHTQLGSQVTGEYLASELWLYPRDSRIALNGSGLLIINPPYLLAERMREWLPELYSQLAVGAGGGCDVRLLGARTPASARPL